MLPTQKPKKVWQAGAAPAVADWEEELDRELEFFTEGMEDLQGGGRVGEGLGDGDSLDDVQRLQIELGAGGSGQPPPKGTVKKKVEIKIPTDVTNFSATALKGMPNSKTNSENLDKMNEAAKAQFEEKQNELIKMITDAGIAVPTLTDDVISQALIDLKSQQEVRKKIREKAFEYKTSYFYYLVFLTLTSLRDALRPIYAQFDPDKRSTDSSLYYASCANVYFEFQNFFNGKESEMKQELQTGATSYTKLCSILDILPKLTELENKFGAELAKAPLPQPAAAAGTPAATGPPPAAAPAPVPPAPAPPAAAPPALAPAPPAPAPAPPAPAPAPPAPAPPAAPDPSAAAAGSASPVPAPPDPSAAPQPAASKVTRGPGVGGAELSETVLFDPDFDFLPENPFYMTDFFDAPGSQFSIDNATKWLKFYVDTCDKFTKLEKQVRSQSKTDADIQKKLTIVLNNLSISQLNQSFWQVLLNSHKKIHPFYEKSKNQKFEKSSAEYIQYKKIMDVHDKILALFIGVEQQISAELKKPSPKIQTGVLFPEDKVKKNKELYESLLTLTDQSNASSSSKQASKKSSSSESDVPTTTFSKRASRADPTDVTELQELLEQTREWGLQMRAAAQENYRIAQKVREFFGAGYEFGEPEALQDYPSPPDM